MNIEIYEAIFKGLQKRFIVEDLTFQFYNNPNGGYDIPVMVKGEITPPRQAIWWECYATIFERPWKVDADKAIRSKKYRLNARIQGHVVKTDEAVRMLIADYDRQQEKLRNVN